MADNVTLNAGTGGPVMSTDDVGGGVQVQRVKVQFGVDGTGTDVSSTDPLPTKTQGDAAHDAAASGNPLLLGAYAKAAAPTNVSADADVARLWATLNGALCVNVTAAGALIPGDATNGLDVDVIRLGGSDVAHDAADAGSPHKVGFKASNALPTAVANADRANGISDLWGRQLTGHIDPAMQVTKGVNYTSTQTGAVIWDPTSGKKIAITSVVVGTYGTTAARFILWFGDNADSTYTAGTDQLLLAASFAPSATSKPGLVFTPAVPVFCTTADRELHITTDAGMSVDITVNGYEW